MILIKLPSCFYNEVGVILIASITYFYSGLGRSYIALLIPQLRKQDSPITLTLEEESWLAPINLFSKMIGSLLGGTISDMFGRSILLQIVPFVFMIGWIVLYVMPITSVLYISMTFNGLAAGMIMTIGLYSLEISSPKQRGFFASLRMPLFTTGMIIGNSLSIVLEWRIAALCFVVFGLFNFLTMFILPETPNYLVQKNRIEKATAVMLKLKKDQTLANENIAELVTSAQNSSNKASGFNLFLIPRVVKDCWRQIRVIFYLPVVAQAAGHSIFNYYCAVIFETLKFPIGPSLSVMMYTVTVCVSSFFGPILIKKLSRRSLLISTGIGMAISISVTILYEILFLHSEYKPYYWVGAGGVYMYVACMQCGISNALNVITGEMYPAEYRGVLSGLFSSLFFLYGSSLTKIFPTLILGSLGAIGTLVLFLFVSLSILPYAMFVLPETSGKTLEEIQKEYFSKPNVKVNVNVNKVVTDNNNSSRHIISESHI